MPYDRNADLPKSVRDHLPQGAQTIYRKAFNSAWDEYREAGKRRGSASREETAHRVAWSAVKESYRKKGDRWVKKDRA
ncbi:MAG TPA: ChaB family protein [Gammaproteobacteria bacterium]|nr:ChaB family protein [Gammaproteobacteria bacterium]